MSAKEQSSKDRRFWRALVPEVPASSTPLDMSPVLSDLNAEQQEHRKQTLNKMLAASQNRQQRALKQKRPDMAIGDTVAVAQGEQAGKHGIVLDADFITGRVQLAIEGVADPLWVSFRAVSSVEP